MKFESEINGVLHQFAINSETGIAKDASGKEIPFQIVAKKSDGLLLRSGTKIYRIANIAIDGNNVEFSINGQFFTARVYDENDLLLKNLGFTTSAAEISANIIAPMPGRVLEILIDEEEYIEKGQPAIVLEAMKMENELISPAEGTVQSIHVATGENVEKNQLLIEIKPRG